MSRIVEQLEQRQMMNGDFGPIIYTPVYVDAPAEGTADVPFEIIIQGDFLGKLIAVQAVSGETASEFSEGVEIK